MTTTMEVDTDPGAAAPAVLGERAAPPGEEAPETADAAAREALDLADRYGVPYLALDEDFRLEPEEVRLVPETVARKHVVIAVKKEDDRALLLVMKDPLDLEAVDTVRALTRLEIRKAVSTGEAILAAIDRFYSADAHIERSLQDIVSVEDQEQAETLLPGESPDSDQLRVQANDAPVVRFVNLLLMQAVRDRASDIHFELGEDKVTVRLRVDGRLREVTPPPTSLYQAIVTRIKILSEMDIAERRLPLDAHAEVDEVGRRGHVAVGERQVVGRVVRKHAHVSVDRADDQWLVLLLG